LSRQWQLLKHAENIPVQYSFAQRLPDMIVSDNPAERYLNIWVGEDVMGIGYVPMGLRVQSGDVLYISSQLAL
jgi:hypothetical protein